MKLRDVQNFCLDSIGRDEGGYFNHPDDPGGMTMRGVTIGRYNAYAAKNGLPRIAANDKDTFIKTVTKELARTIFLEDYWKPMERNVDINNLHPCVQYPIFDLAVNSGTGRPQDLIRRMWGQGSGNVAPLTAAEKKRLKEESDRNPVEWGIRLTQYRINVYLPRLKNWPSFKNGWTNRCNRVIMDIKKLNDLVKKTVENIAQALKPKEQKELEFYIGKYSERDPQMAKFLKEYYDLKYKK